MSSDSCTGGVICHACGYISSWQTCQCQDFSPSDENHPNIEREAPTVCLVEVEQGTKYLLWITGIRGLGVSRSLSLILALLPSLEPWAHCFRSHLLMEKDEQYICLSLLMKEYNNVKMMSKYYSVHRNSRGTQSQSLELCQEVGSQSHHTRKTSWMVQIYIQPGPEVILYEIQDRGIDNNAKITMIALLLWAQFPHL